MIRVSILLVAVLASAACKNKADAGSSDKPATAAKASPTQLPNLGLRIDVPGKVSVGDAVMGEGHMLQGSSIGAMQVEIAQKPQSLDEAKSDVDMYSPTNLATETLPDGWVLTFENTGAGGRNYWVAVHREIGGKPITCTTTGGEAARAAAVVAACKSLRI
jgi:hypothetical protein